LSTNAYSYSWDFGNNQNSIVENPSTEYLAEGTYTITLTATSALCGSSTWTSNISVLADLPLVYTVPNVFTPGGNDAINNSYFIPTENAKSFEAIIINRWGNVIYEMNQINQMWDGKTASGDEAEEGVYFIKFKIENLKGEFIEGQNFFHLVR
jgi:gliding motility-associated-like protein